MGYYAGIDVGGTKIYSVIIDEEGNVLARAKVKTGGDTDFEVILEKILACYRTACDNAGVDEAQRRSAAPSSARFATPYRLRPTQRDADC